MNILFLGYAVNRKYEDSLNGISVAGNKMQVNLLRELKYINNSTYIVSIPPVASFPKYKNIIINRGTIDIDEKQKIFGVVPHILNVPFIKNIYEIINTYREAKCIVKNHSVRKILIFNAFPQTSFAALRLKKKFKIEVTCLLADLPIDDSINTRGLKAFLRYIFDKYTKKAIMQMDKLIVLNQHAATVFAPDVPYIVMEGAINIMEVKPFLYVCPKRKNIVFSGALQKHNGIKELIDGIVLASDTGIELDVYGIGDYRDYVIESAKKYPSIIHYCGVLNNEAVQEVQRNAFLLINPRPVNNSISTVTFPSKIFEYMTSCTPVITTKLNCFTPEYYNTMFFIENNDPCEINRIVREILSMEEDRLFFKAREAYSLIVKRKNWEIQAKRILQFIEG